MSFISIDLYDNIVYNNRVKREFIYRAFQKMLESNGIR